MKITITVRVGKQDYLKIESSKFNGARAKEKCVRELRNVANDIASRELHDFLDNYFGEFAKDV